MHRHINYQQRQLEAIHTFYTELRKSSAQEFSLKDVVLTWFTEGYAERFRAEYLKNQTSVSYIES